MLFDLLRLASLGQNMELYASLQIRQPQLSRQTAEEELISTRRRQGNEFPARQTNPVNHQHQNISQPQARGRERGQDTRQRQEKANLRKQSSSSKVPEFVNYGNDQYKPLDLSVKSVIDTERKSVNQTIIEQTTCKLPVGNKQQRRRGSNRPAPILLVPVSVGSRQRARHARSKVQSRTSTNSSTLSTSSTTKNQHLKLISSSTSPSSCSPGSLWSPQSDNQESKDTLELRSSELISSTNAPDPERNIVQRRRQKLKGLKSHLCLQCGRSFSRSDMLTRHSRLHSGLKPYQCSRCKQVFSRSDHLSTHERTHTGEKPYHCKCCSYSACRRDMITRHMRTHSGDGSSTRSPKQRAPSGSSPESQLLVGYNQNDEISTSSLEEEEEDEDEDEDEEEALEDELNVNGLETDDDATNELTEGD